VRNLRKKGELEKLWGHTYFARAFLFLIIQNTYLPQKYNVYNGCIVLEKSAKSFFEKPRSKHSRCPK